MNLRDPACGSRNAEVINIEAQQDDPSFDMAPPKF
jgi:hypothetical protein